MIDLQSFIDEKVAKIAVGVSGGADSLALAHMLCFQDRFDIEVHILTVNHALRDESAQEALFVADLVQKWPRASHHILTWEGDKPDKRIQEEARVMRYGLIKKYMKNNALGHLFMAQHEDDQGETFLIRLSKGSGLEGLSCMRATQDIGDGITLCRPLLNKSHQWLKDYLESKNIKWIEDPSNENQNFLRPRLRKARAVLEQEGLTNKRLAKTAARMARANEALSFCALQFFDEHIRTVTDGFEIEYKKWIGLPEDVRLRIIILVQEKLRPDQPYRPRMEKMESLIEALAQPEGFTKRTLGGCVFEINLEKDIISVSKEG